MYPSQERPNQQPPESPRKDLGSIYALQKGFNELKQLPPVKTYIGELPYKDVVIHVQNYFGLTSETVGEIFQTPPSQKTDDQSSFIAQVRDVMTTDLIPNRPELFTVPTHTVAFIKLTHDLTANLRISPTDRGF